MSPKLQKVITTIPDFDQGVYNNTQHIAYGDGAVELIPVIVATIKFDIGATTRNTARPNFLSINASLGSTTRQVEKTGTAMDVGTTRRGESRERIGFEAGATTSGRKGG